MMKEVSFNEAESIIAAWRNDPLIEQVEPDVEFCDCPGQGIYDVEEQVMGHYENGRYIGSISGVLMVCDACGKQVFATMQNHFVEM